MALMLKLHFLVNEFSSAATRQLPTITRHLPFGCKRQHIKEESKASKSSLLILNSLD